MPHRADAPPRRRERRTSRNPRSPLVAMAWMAVLAQTRVACGEVPDLTMGHAFPLEAPTMQGLPLERVSALTQAGDGWLLGWISRRVAFGEPRAFVVPVSPDRIAGQPHLVSWARAEDLALGCAGDGCAAAWRDPMATGINGVRVARMSLDGRAIDPEGLLIAGPLRRYVGDARIACRDGECPVVWTQRASVEGATNDIHAARVSTVDGLLDPSGFVVAATLDDEHWPSVAWDGRTWLVAWAASRRPAAGGFDADVLATRIDATGSVLDSPALELDVTPAVAGRADVTSNGTGFLLAWPSSEGWWEPQDTLMTAVSSDGDIAVPANAVATSDVARWGPRVASSANGHLITWTDRSGGVGRERILGARVDNLGALVDGPPETAGFPVATSPDAFVASSASQYLVAGDGAMGPWTALVRPDGTVDGQVQLLPWRAATRQGEPVVATNASGESLVAWVELDGLGTNGNILPARVSRDGEVLDPERITVAAPGAHEHAPAIASNGDDWLIAWQEERGTLFSGFGCDALTSVIRAARVTSRGVVRDEPGLLFDETRQRQCRPTVASNGRDYLVAWEDWDGLACELYVDVRGARVDASSGRVLDVAALDISSARCEQTAPDATFDGTSYVVAWEDVRRRCCGVSSDIFATRVSRAGIVLDPDGIAVAVASGFPSLKSPAIASNGLDMLVTWLDFRNAATVGREVRAKRLRGDLAGLDGPPESSGILLSEGGRPLAGPAISAGGGSYLVAWTADGQEHHDIEGRRVTASGQVLDPWIQRFQGGPFDDDQPSLSGGCSEQLLVYRSFLDEPGIQAVRVLGRRVIDGRGAATTEVSSPSSRAPLMVSKHASGRSLDLQWEDHGGCVSYNIYAGALGDWTQAQSALCHEGGVLSSDGVRSAAIQVPERDAYFLITASDALREATPGWDSVGRERSAPPMSCGPE